MSMSMLISSPITPDIVSLSVADDGERVALMPTHQRFDAALGELAVKAGLAKICNLETGCICSSGAKSAIDLTPGSRR